MLPKYLRNDNFKVSYVSKVLLCTLENVSNIVFELLKLILLLHSVQMIHFQEIKHILSIIIQLSRYLIIRTCLVPSDPDIWSCNLDGTRYVC